VHRSQFAPAPPNLRRLRHSNMTPLMWLFWMSAQTVTVRLALIFAKVSRTAEDHINNI
jgi:hypothetical protein